MISCIIRPGAPPPDDRPEGGFASFRESAASVREFGVNGNGKAIFRLAENVCGCKLEEVFFHGKPPCVGGIPPLRCLAYHSPVKRGEYRQSEGCYAVLGRVRQTKKGAEFRGSKTLHLTFVWRHQRDLNPS